MPEGDYGNYHKQIDKLSRQVSKFLKDFSNVDFITMFGNHKMIVVTRDGQVEVEDYEHE
jgi:hypothetical protein